MTSSDLDILAYEETPLGTLCLRRRPLLHEPGTTVTEVTLNHELLMNSYHTVSERALASIALEWHGGTDLAVLIGGLGLGYTARETLQSAGVKSAEVVEFLPQVIAWMEKDLLPLSGALRSDKRLQVVKGNIYERLSRAPETRFDTILIDVDHSPDERLDVNSGRFYTREGLKRVKEHLAPGGILGVWSYTENPSFTRALQDVFPKVKTETVSYKTKIFNNDNYTDWLFFARV